jgi:hypothetical protein
MYNATTKGLKALSFTVLLNLLQAEGCFDIIVQRARAIDQDSKNWDLTADERKELLLSVAKNLDAERDDGAFSVLHAYLR